MLAATTEAKTPWLTGLTNALRHLLWLHGQRQVDVLPRGKDFHFRFRKPFILNSFMFTFDQKGNPLILVMDGIKMDWFSQIWENAEFVSTANTHYVRFSTGGSPISHLPQLSAYAEAHSMKLYIDVEIDGRILNHIRQFNYISLGMFHMCLDEAGEKNYKIHSLSTQLVIIFNEKGEHYDGHGPQSHGNTLRQTGRCTGSSF